MKKIIAPLQLNDKGETVANLQQVLHQFYDKQLLNLEPADAEVLFPILDKEQGEMVFGVATGKLVQRFNKQYRHNDLHWVDEATDQVLNDVLRELGALDNGLPVPERMVAGQVVSSTTLNVLLEDQAVSALRSEEELKKTMQEGKRKDYEDYVKHPY